jgi:hypothetical protein
VELDDTTARISRLLYPDATVRSESFADTRIPANTFDATIGNVPFADLVLHDPIDNANRHALHNHFILKSSASPAPAGSSPSSPAGSPSTPPTRQLDAR